MSNAPFPEMRTFEAAQAEDVCRRYNAHRKSNFFVMVDGPEGGVVVMSLKSAIAEGFLYRWVA